MPKKEKTNKQFMVLSFIVIIVMVICHLGGGWFEYIRMFPFIAIFIFISGYFYKEEKEENLLKYIWYKFKKLMIPFFVINLIYALIINGFKYAGIINYGADITLYNFFVQPFINNSQYVINFPAWFIPTLFLTICTFSFIHKYARKIKFVNDYVLFAIFLVLHILSIYLRQFFAFESIMVAPLKVMFFLVFFELGYLYNQKWQKYENKIPTIPYLIVLFLINFLAQKFIGNLNYDMHEFSGLVTNIIGVPFLTSVIGILFYNRIARILAPKIGENKVVNYISNHTYAILEHHLFIMFCLNLVLYITKIPNFNVEDFKNGWICLYRIPGYDYILSLFYVILAIAGSLFLQKIYDKIKEIYFKKCCKKDKKMI